MKVFVTGTDGYIGSILSMRLIRAGHTVLGLDTGFYKDGWLFSDPEFYRESIPSLGKDLRDISREDLSGFDAVVHLAELSNDPLGANNPRVTRDINFRGTLRLAEFAREAGVPRFVYTSSCSVYGVASEELVDEESAVNPQTAYAECKVLVEDSVSKLAGSNFCPVFLRNATAYGASPRMRFDIVLNNLSGLAHTINEIAMTSDGSPWRPLVHVDDISSAILCSLQAPEDRVRGEIFNVGSNGENYRVREIAEFVKAVYPDCKLTFGDPAGDNRSYKVSFDKIERSLPGFAARWNAREGAQQLHDLFTRIGLTRSMFDFRAFTRLRQLEHLQRTGQLDTDFYWTKSCKLSKPD
jgi:nucleoside-diphosphate-sugar epimerase